MTNSQVQIFVWGSGGYTLMHGVSSDTSLFSREIIFTAYTNWACVIQHRGDGDTSLDLYSGECI